MDWFNKERSAVTVLLVFAAVIKFAAIVVLKVPPESDYAAYLQMASTMLETGHMDDGQGNVAFYSAGYPLFLIPFFALFGASADVAQVVNALLGVLSVWLVYLVARKLLADFRWALLPAVVWATYPPAILYTEYVAKENLMVLLLLLQVMLLVNYHDSSRKQLLAAALGVVFGFELLVGPAVLFTGAIIGLVVLNLRYKPLDLSGIRWGQPVACILGALLVLSPWFSYTHAKLGTSLLNTNGAFNLYLGNNPNADVGFKGITETPMGNEWHALRRQAGEIQAFAVLKTKAIDYIFENPGKTIWLSIKKAVYFWTPPVHAGRDGNQSTAESLIRLVWLLYYVVIILFALVPLLFYRQLNRTHAILYSSVALYCLIHGAAYIIFRYRLPVMPMMTLLAASGLQLAYAWRQSRITGLVPV